MVILFLIGAADPFPETSAFHKMVRLEAPVVWDAVSYYLVAAVLAAGASPPAQPASWTGSVSQARKVLRQSGLIHFWWLYESFIAVN